MTYCKFHSCDSDQNYCSHVAQEIDQELVSLKNNYYMQDYQIECIKKKLDHIEEQMHSIYRSLGELLEILGDAAKANGQPLGS